MEFRAPPRRRRPPEPIVPMINVVFLLLIFFLMSARIAPPAPLEVSLPESAATGRAAPADTLHIDAAGRLAFNAARDDEVFALLAARASPDGPLRIRADAALEARVLARLLRELAARGVAAVEIVTAPR